MGASILPENFEFSKSCEDISSDFWEEFSRNKLPARPIDNQNIKKILITRLIRNL